MSSKVPYNCALNLEHFSDPHFSALIKLVFSHLDRSFPDFPNNHELAKVWEIAQAVRGLGDFGALHPSAKILGVAAGCEHTVFYLTKFVDCVFATDLYATNDVWKEADRLMLTKPEAFVAPGLDWDPQRLFVQHMDALDLRFPDHYFDGVFSCGSIEHFGSVENVAQSAREMARVIRPGGIVCLATEFRIKGDAAEIGVPGAIMFTPDFLREHIVEASGLELVDEPSFTVTPATSASAYPIREAIDQGVRDRSIALTLDDWMWTSVSLCMRKPAIY